MAQPLSVESLENQEIRDFIGPLDPRNLNPEQRTAMDELKRRLSDDKYQEQNFNKEYLRDEYILMHWLKARKFDPEKAEAMLRNHLRYRKAVGLDKPDYKKFASPTPFLTKYYTRGRYGMDRLGHPLVYFPFGCIDSKGLMNSVRMSELLRALLYWQEERRWSCDEMSAKIGRRVQQVIYILDLKGIGAKHLYRPGIGCFQEVAKIVEAHLPEILYKVRVINAPNLFDVIYRMVRPILDEATIEKLKVYGSEGWKQALLEEVNADQLPVFYGGTAVGPDNDPKCSHAIAYGGEIPVSEYFTAEKKSKLLPENTQLKSLRVPRSDRVALEYRVDEQGSILFWYFESLSSHDIAFGVYRKPDKMTQEENVKTTNSNFLENYEMVFPHFRLITHIVPEWGHVRVDSPGTYVLVFDNTYSWVNSKDLQYYAVVVPKNSPLLDFLPIN